MLIVAFNRAHTDSEGGARGSRHPESRAPCAEPACGMRTARGNERTYGSSCEASVAVGGFGLSHDGTGWAGKRDSIRGPAPGSAPIPSTRQIRERITRVLGIRAGIPRRLGRGCRNETEPHRFVSGSSYRPWPETGPNSCRFGVLLVLSVPRVPGCGKRNWPRCGVARELLDPDASHKCVAACHSRCELRIGLT